MKKFALALACGICGLIVSATAHDATVAAKVEALGRINSATSPSLSPDGRRVAYLTNASGSPQIWIRNLDGGGTRQVTDLPDPVGSVHWSPTGNRLAYTVEPGGGLNTQIWIVNADGSGARRFTLGGNGMELDLDGR